MRSMGQNLSVPTKKTEERLQFMKVDNPFAGIDAEREEIEALRQEVAQLRKLVDYIMESTTLLMQVENFRVEKIRKK